MMEKKVTNEKEVIEGKVKMKKKVTEEIGKGKIKPSEEKEVETKVTTKSKKRTKKANIKMVQDDQLKPDANNKPETSNPKPSRRFKTKSDVNHKPGSNTQITPTLRTNTDDKVKSDTSKKKEPKLKNKLVEPKTPNISKKQNQ